MKKGEAMIPRTDRMAEIARGLANIIDELPDRRFGTLVLEKIIKQCGLGKQSVGGYIGELLRAGYIAKSGDKFILTDAAKTPGKIVITVNPAVRVPEVREKIESIIREIEHATIEEV